MPKQPKQKSYELQLVVNGETHKVKTDDLKKSILKIKPETVFTEGYLTITENKNGGVFEKRFTLVQLKKLFNNEEQIDLLLNTFYSLYK